MRQMRRPRPQGGVGEAVMPLTPTTEEPEGSGMENGPGGAAAGGGATSDTTSEDADVEGAGSRLGRKKGKGRGSPAGRKTRPGVLCSG